MVWVGMLSCLKLEAQSFITRPVRRAANPACTCLFQHSSLGSEATHSWHLLCGWQESPPFGSVSGVSCCRFLAE